MNTNQILAIILVILGALVAGTANLTDLFGPTEAKIIVSAAGLGSSILSGVLGVLTGQSGQIKAVQAMPGVDKIVVNKDASPTLASLAVDPAQQKIEAAPGAEAAVRNTANGTR